MSLLLLKLSYLLLCIGTDALIGYGLWQAARLSDASVYRHEMRQYWSEYAAVAETERWPFNDGQGF